MTLDRLREILPDAYLAKRPSYSRVVARAAKAGLPCTRDDYDGLMRDIRKLRTLFEQADVDPSQVHLQKYVVNSWGRDNFQVKAWLQPKNAKADAAKPRKLRTLKAIRSPATLNSLYIPDCHVGYCGDEPIHDEDSMALVWEVARRWQPPNIVVLGDFLDLAGFGSYSTAPPLRHVTNAAVQRAYDWLVMLREHCPESRIVYLEGNHEQRIQRYLHDRAPELAGVRRPHDMHDAMSLPHLLHLTDLRVEYVGPYRTPCWVDGVRTIHGDLLGKRGGDTVSKLLATYKEPTVCGHGHRLELAFGTEWRQGGAYDYWAMMAGTLARRDGMVPGSSYPDWMQGCGGLWQSGTPSIHPVFGGSISLLSDTIGAR